MANIKELGAGTIEIKYEISEEENSNNDIVGLYNIITTMSNTFFDSKQNMWLYNDNIAYNVVIKGWYDNQYNNITYANLTVRLMSNHNGYKLGFNGFIDVDNVSEDNSTDSKLCVGYVSGKYNITDDLLTVITPEKKFEISENKLII